VNIAVPNVLGGDFVSVAKAATEWRIGAYRADPYRWCLEQVRTFDEQDDTDIALAKPFPSHDYLREVMKEIHANRFVAIEKSRQMRASWLLAAYLTWSCQFHPATRWGVMSTKEETSDAFIERCHHIAVNQSPWLVDRYPVGRKMGVLAWEHKSFIQGVATTDKSGRSYTFTGILIDEAAWQENVGVAYTANMPAVQNKGRMILCSSPQANTFFTQLVDDRMDEGVEDGP
jgi:hypothetical protein